MKPDFGLGSSQMLQILTVEPIMVGPSQDLMVSLRTVTKALGSVKEKETRIVED